ncbi:hypothetical protein tinsulaeT_24300 [Thalassotalea insulae]|uniref:Major facilitator superfamily (MFS) profile domain-containing protein n=1 Tax=Thalassotalea insulae TaxID=2056778 RepID=A0ABQ6GX50_9GAMM|nr:MFS transporter [Thalassotalea insulae]GLX79090.1 hypothetical protein tinsulaeT_24300 [Thalassotalea insulae]
MDKAIPPTNTLMYFFFAFIAMVGTSYINFLPGVVNALAGSIGFSEAEAGQIVALNIYGALSGSIAAVFLIGKVNWKCVLALFLVLLATFDLSTSWISDYIIMLVWRFIAGFIGGFCMGISFSILARLASPDRAFGALLFTQFGICFVVLAILPSLEAILDPYAVFYVMGVLSLVSVCILFTLPDQSLKADAPTEIKGRIINKTGAALLMSALMLYLCAANAIWTYVGLIGLNAGIAEQNVNNAIAITSLLGLIGALLPVLIGKRLGRLFCIISGIVFSIIAAFLLSLKPMSIGYYVIAMSLIFFAWPAVNAYLLATTAEMDPSGKLSSIAALVSLFGAASGPMMASGLIGDGDFTSMLYSCSAIFIVSAIFSIRPTQQQTPDVTFANANQA